MVYSATMPTIYGTDQSETLTGTSGDDVIYGYGGDDQILPSNGQDTIYGGDGDDFINVELTANLLTPAVFSYWYSAESLTIFGGNGNDFVAGGQSGDVIYGDEGDDVLHGIEGDDVIYGGAGNDYIEGDSGNDTLRGEGGNNKLIGGPGNDILYGGAGFDRLWGGDGDDTYIINSLTFDLLDFGDNDTAIVNINFVKIPSRIENITYSEGVQALPYWINTLLFDAGASFSSKLGAEKAFGFGFPDSIPGYVDNAADLNEWETFNSNQRVFTRSALEYIASVIDVRFTEVSDVDALNILSFANNTPRDGFDGFAYGPDLNSNGNDVYIKTRTDTLVPKEGESTAYLWMHEIGHALGLKHTTSTPQLNESEDKVKWTQMSKVDILPSEYYIKFNPLDIAALQYLYGPSPASRAGNDTYTFDTANANFIWDGAGTDTIDASGVEEKVTIYLEPGYWGFKGEAKAETITSNGQITVNFGTKIENLIGSNFDDHLVGNELNNLITGRVGSDNIDGEGGIDTAVYTVNFDEASLSNFVDYGSSGGTIQLGTAWNVVSGNETDTLRNIERLKFNDKYIALDLDGNAGQTVKLLGLLLGKDQATNKTYIGAGLKLLDDGMTYEQLMSAGLDVVLGANASSLSVVELIWNNLIGPPTPADNISQYSALIDNGTYTSAGLAIVAADHSLNTTAIDLVGLAQTGVEYILYG